MSVFKYLYIEGCLIVGSATIKPSETIRNLGAIFDSTMSMVQHVNSVTKSVYHQLKRIKTIRCHLDSSTCAKIINAAVTSRLDFNNGLLVGLPQKTLSRLQVAQNSAARLLTGALRRDHITPILKELHWLPVNQRILFKCLNVVMKGLKTTSSPAYMKDIVTPYTQSRQLRSESDRFRLTVSRARGTFGSRTLSYTIAKLWNSLPEYIRALEPTNFKGVLKTYLFREAFN